jgi:hypothetical protein
MRIPRPRFQGEFENEPLMLQKEFFASQNGCWKDVFSYHFLLISAKNEQF